MPIISGRIRYVIVILLLHLSSCVYRGQEKEQITARASTVVEIDSLNTYPGNKIIEVGYQKEVLAALLYYPELKNTAITFKSAKIRTTSNARPNIFSLLFSSRSNRSYTIRINNTVTDSVIDYDAVPFDAKIGLIGHELAHIVDYEHKSIGGVVMRLFAYAMEKSKSEFEREIDSLTVNHGLGEQLYDWAHFVLYESEARQKYKIFKQRVYMTPAEIKLMTDAK